MRLSQIVYISFIATIYLAGLLSAHAQIISGRVVDSLTNAPVPNAHVYCEAHHTGTITNELGEFELVLPQQDVHLLKISHIGYEPEMMMTNGSELNVRLNNRIVLLEEVVISDEITSLVHKILGALKDKRISHGEAFYRQVSKQGSLAIEFIEALYDLSLSQNGIDKIRIVQARFARRRETEKSLYVSIANFSYLTIGYTLYSERKVQVAKPFSAEYIDYYDFTKTAEYAQGGDIHYVIEFKPSETLDAQVLSYGTFIYNFTKGQLVAYDAYVDHALGADQLTGGLQDRPVKMEKPRHHWHFNFSDHGVNFILTDFNYLLIVDGVEYPGQITSKMLIYKTKQKPSGKLREPALDYDGPRN